VALVPRLVGTGVERDGCTVNAVCVRSPADLGVIAGTRGAARLRGPEGAVAVAAVALVTILCARVRVLVVRAGGDAGFYRVVRAGVRRIWQIPRLALVLVAAERSEGRIASSRAILRATVLGEPIEAAERKDECTAREPCRRERNEKAAAKVPHSGDRNTPGRRGRAIADTRGPSPGAARRSSGGPPWTLCPVWARASTH
jgi:hypothetical protein